jgi:hypothetical protein
MLRAKLNKRHGFPQGTPMPTLRKSRRVGQPMYISWARKGWASPPPYETDSRKWLRKLWIDQYSGKEYRITTVGHHGDRHTARVKTYGDVLREYEYHPESKYADAKGKPCGKQTVGLLQRRHVRIDEIKYIGKESNSLEEVEEGLIHSPENVYTEYSDPRRDAWQTKIPPALEKIPVPILMKISDKSRSTIFEWLAGRSRPHRKTQKLLGFDLAKPITTDSDDRRCTHLRGL